MNELNIVIEQSENNYAAYIDHDDLGGIITTGATIEEIKTNMVEAINYYIESMVEEGFELPDILKGDYQLTFKMDVKSLLNVYSKLFTKAGLERITGINQKQLWHYASGTSNPRPEQVRKLEHALHQLGAELLSITL
ncbi:MAG: type II toxin-antitoxin system HicB family antitoxin [Tannerellaceae bacterium]